MLIRAKSTVDQRNARNAASGSPQTPNYDVTTTKFTKMSKPFMSAQFVRKFSKSSPNMIVTHRAIQWIQLISIKQNKNYNEKKKHQNMRQTILAVDYYFQNCFCNFCFRSSECTICKILYRHRRGLDAHAFEEHSGPKKCTRCDLGFESNSLLRRHTLEVHERVRVPKECRYCPLVFKSKTKLERHSGTHPYPYERQINADADPDEQL